MKKLGIQHKDLEITNKDLLEQAKLAYSLVIYFARTVELNFIIVLLIILHQTKIFIDVQTIKNNSTKSCTSHNIKDYVLKELVLDNIKQVISYISSYEDLFIKEKLETSI